MDLMSLGLNSLLPSPLLTLNDHTTVFTESPIYQGAQRTRKTWKHLEFDDLENTWNLIHGQGKKWKSIFTHFCRDVAFYNLLLIMIETKVIDQNFVDFFQSQFTIYLLTKVL